MNDWLHQLQQVWSKRITEAKEAKQKVFGETAEELWNFFTKNYDDLYVARLAQSPLRRSEPPPLYRVRINKCQEFVDLYLPFILSTNPVRRVSPRRPQLPEDILQMPMPMPVPVPQPILVSHWDKAARTQLDTAALLLEWWLQYSAEEYRLLREARLAATEALIKGRGVVWHELVPTASGMLPASFFDSVDNLFIDPATETLRDAGYIIRRRRLASWQAAARLGMDEKKLLSIAKKESDKEEDTDTPIVEYYEVYSRIGLGSRLVGPDEPLREWQDALDAHGPYVYLAIAPDAEYPLNLDPDVIQQSPERLTAAITWPLETYGDILNPWPVSILDFHPHTADPWARSPLEPGLPMQVILDHLYSLIYSQARRSMSTIIVVPSHADDNFVRSLRYPKDFEVVTVNSQQIGDLSKDLYAVIPMPTVSQDLWAIFQAIEEQFARAVGLDPFLYGAQPPTQPRSAAEVQIRYQAASGRAQAMAERVEDWMTQIAAKEGIITRLYVPWTQMAKLFGEPILPVPTDGSVPTPPGNATPGAMPGGILSAIWAQVITASDPVAAGADFHFRIVSGSGRRKDKQQQVETAKFIAQTVLPVALRYGAGTNDYSYYNRVLEKLSNALDVDLSMFRFESLPNTQGVSNGPGQMDSGRNQEPRSINRES